MDKKQFKEMLAEMLHEYLTVTVFMSDTEGGIKAEVRIDFDGINIDYDSDRSGAR